MLAGGCAPAILSVDDAVQIADQPVLLAAHAARPQLFGLRSEIDHVPVSFVLGGREVARGDTGRTGRATAECTPPADAPDCFEARAMIDGRERCTSGTIFHWHADRPIIAVDIDNTVSRTDYDELILQERSKDSRPIPRSRETLSDLARDFHIAYVTARPRFMLEKTRAWLAEHEFPSGPVITASRLRDVMQRSTLKRKMFADLRTRWPNLLIGIGNNRYDADASGANEMLALVINPYDDGYGVHATLFPDWEDVHRFFDDNRDVLAAPEQLRAVIRGETAILRTIPRWREPVPRPRRARN